MENLWKSVRKHRDIKLVTTNKRRTYLVSGPNYHATNCFSKNLLTIEMLKVKIEMNKLVYLGLSILELSKTVMYEFWYKYVETKYWYNAKLCFMVTEKLIKHIKTEDVYKEIVYNAEEKFDTSNYGIELPLPIGKNKKVIGLMIDVLGRKIMPQFVG